MHRDAAPRTWILRGAAWPGWPHDDSARPQELYRAASATPCDESMCSRRRAPTSPPSDQRIRFSFAVEPNSVLLYWHKKHQRGGPLYEHNDILEVVLNKITEC